MRLLALRDLRLVWLAAVVSWSGDALSFLAFMWLAYDVGGATGVVDRPAGRQHPQRGRGAAAPAWWPTASSGAG